MPVLINSKSIPEVMLKGSAVDVRRMVPFTSMRRDVAGTDNLVKTVRLDDAEVEEILNKLDTDQHAVDPNKRAEARYQYRVKRCVVHLQSQGGGTTAYLVPTRNLSATGIGFLHGSFVYPGSKCLIQLTTMHGTWHNVPATVVRCNYITGRIHEVGVRFLESIDPSEFCAEAATTRVLLVEDDASITRLAKALLKSLNAEVTHAADGEAAIELALSQIFDVVMLDLEMPVLNGFEAITQLRAKGYSGRVCAVTAMTQPEDRQKCLEAGCDQYLPKPYTKDMLSSLLASLRKEPLISSLADQKDMVPLIDAFVEELPAKIRKIEEAAANQDATALVSSARALKGEAGGYGFDPISIAAGTVESAALAQKAWPEIKPAMDELIDLCCQARASTRKTTAQKKDKHPDTPVDADSDSDTE